MRQPIQPAIRALLICGMALLVGLAGLAALRVVSMRALQDSRVNVPRHEIALPPPNSRSDMSVAEALRRRRSHREFADRSLSMDEVSQLCWAAQGITDREQGLRTAPSAGALYPITIFVVDRDGIFQFQPANHSLSRVIDGDKRGQLQAAALNQDCVGAAPVCFAIAIDVARTASKYGGRAERYCLLEAGHVAQNLLLQATAIDLVGVPVGAFDDRRVAAVLNLPRNLQPVYLLPVGHPRQE